MLLHGVRVDYIVGVSQHALSGGAVLLLRNGMMRVVDTCPCADVVDQYEALMRAWNRWWSGAETKPRRGDIVPDDLMSSTEYDDFFAAGAKGDAVDKAVE
jgi:hypothetical protein